MGQVRLLKLYVSLFSGPEILSQNFALLESKVSFLNSEQISCSTVRTTVVNHTGKVLVTSLTAVLLLEVEVMIVLLRRQQIRLQVNPPKKASLVLFNMTVVCGTRLLPIKMKKYARMVIISPKIGMISHYLKEELCSFPVPLIAV